MNWFVPRMLFAALLAALGAVLGSAIGWGSDTVILVTVLGAAGGAMVSAFIDRMKGYRLMKWVRGERLESAPRDRAFWGELAYRVEKALHEADRHIAAERAQTAEFLAAIEASPNGVLLLDAREQIDWCNSVAADHLGLDPRRDRGQRITNLVRDPAFVAYLQDGRFDQPVSFAARRGQGTISVLVRPYGRGRRLVLSQDITERERSESMRRDFVANVSHEIRTPLTVLAGFVETLASLPLTEVERQRVLSLMQQQTARMQDLVADLLTLAQLEGSPRPPADRWVPVRGLLDRALADGKALSAGRHALHADLADVSHELAGSLTELQSALGNLVSNAVRYTPDGGHIRLRWRRRAEGGGMLEVEDDGPGIAREHLPRLTERFYRVDGSRSRETGGTGLGLSIVKHVMQRHGGEIEIVSEPGKGSCFRLDFPAARVRESVEMPAAGGSATGAEVDSAAVAAKD